MTNRVSIYARYSSDLQSDASIDDQIRLCAEKATTEGWPIVKCYTDAGVSGASLMRPAIQSLMSAAMNGKFEIVLAEALDRLSRNQADIAAIFERLEFAGVKIITLSEGEISVLHIGLKGTMNAMFLKDLADKTRRGLRGKIEKGKSGGGLAYGYKVVRQFTPQGEAIKGDCKVDEKQAQVVRRIFHEFAILNKSPKSIAHGLNSDGVVGPSKKQWSQSTINGNRKRGTGILNNLLYKGELVWNRQRFLKNPSTGRRVPRYNPESEWIRKDLPELRIVPQNLWDAAKARQKSLEKLTGNMGKCRRAHYLLSGLINCSRCGGNYSKTSATRYGCSAFKNKGVSVCTNRRTIRRDFIEGKVIDALTTHIHCHDKIEEFCDEFELQWNRRRRTQNSAINSYKAEKEKLTKERENFICAIRSGIETSLVKDDLTRVAVRLEELDTLLTCEDDDFDPLLRPTTAEHYPNSVSVLRDALRSDGGCAETIEALRGLVDKVVLTAIEGHEELQINLYGDLAGILSTASSKSSQQTRTTLDSYH